MKSKAASFKLRENEVMVAIESLYADKVQPHSCILLKRVYEQVAVKLVRSGRFDVAPHIKPAELRRVCERSNRIVVHEDQRYGNQRSGFIALLPGYAATFVDPNNEDDPYPEELWHAFEEFVNSNPWCGSATPSGRFAYGQAMAARRLPWLASFSLGEIVLMVQLAVTNRKILEYDNGILKSSRHRLVAKEETCPHSIHSRDVERPVASWEDVIKGVAALLTTVSCDEGGIPVERLQVLFRDVFGMELNASALGYSRIMDLVDDPKIRRVCRLYFDGRSRTIMGLEPQLPQFQYTCFKGCWAEIVGSAVEVDAKDDAYHFAV